MKEVNGRDQRPAVRWMMMLLMALVLATAISGVLYTRPMVAKAYARPMAAKEDNGDNYLAAWKANTTWHSVCSKDTWGYCQRWCTSWVAWALHDRNGFEMPYAIGDASAWKSWAQKSPIYKDKINSTPGVGSVAWFSYGHVAYVSNVSADNKTVTLQEYNFEDSNHNKKFGDDGTYSTRTIAASSVNSFIHFADLPTSTTILQVRKKTMSDGTNEVFWSNASGVYRSAWKGNSGVGLITLFSGSGIVSFDLQINHDGQYLLYVATSHDVYEVWWYDPRSPHPNKIVANGGNLLVIQKAIDPTSGKQLLYVMNDKGVDEYSWTPGSTIHGRNIGVLSNPVAMKWATELDGTKLLLAANANSWKVFRWYGSNTAIVSTAGNMSGITSLDFSLSSDGKHRLYLGTSSGLWEINWYPGGGIGTWQINNTPAIGVQKWQDDSTLQVLYYATTYGVYEYYWKTTDNNSLKSDTIIENKGSVQAFTRSTDPGMQTVYLATDTKVWEAWWGDGNAIRTGIVLNAG